MKAAAILFCSFLLLATACFGQPDSAGMIKYYAIKSARIKYRFSNGLQEGEKSLIFDDWGNYEKLTLRIHTNNIGAQDSLLSKMAGTNANVMYLKTPSAVYSVDLDKKTVLRTPHIPLEMSPFFPGDSSRLQKVGTDTILGRLCVVSIVDKVQKIWLWKGIVLKKELLEKADGFTIGESAIAIDENYIVHTNEFAVPFQ